MAIVIEHKEIVITDDTLANVALTVHANGLISLDMGDDLGMQAGEARKLARLLDHAAQLIEQREPED
ncbi:MAG: hypothetical protein AAF711_00460 [Planctomycetota bacterium]